MSFVRSHASLLRRTFPGKEVLGTKETLCFVIALICMSLFFALEAEGWKLLCILLLISRLVGWMLVFSAMIAARFHCGHSTVGSSFNFTSFYRFILLFYCNFILFRRPVDETNKMKVYSIFCTSFEFYFSNVVLYCRSYNDA